MRRKTWTIDAFDYLGDTWRLRAPPLQWDERTNEAWMIVEKTSAEGAITNYPCIPVPCFTEWWP